MIYGIFFLFGIIIGAVIMNNLVCGEIKDGYVVCGGEYYNIKKDT